MCYLRDYLNSDYLDFICSTAVVIIDNSTGLKIAQTVVKLRNSVITIGAIETKFLEKRE